MRFSLIILIIVSLAGCSNLPKEVDIPIAIKNPSPKLPPKPDLPIGKLTKNSSESEVMKAYASSVKKLMDDDNYCRAVCQPQS